MAEINIKELAKGYYKNRLNLTIEDVEKLLQDVYEEGVKDDYSNTSVTAINDCFQGIYSQHSPQPHYDNSKGSLYKFAEDHKLNAWEFDIVKRIVRSRKKGQFKEDLQKTKDVIDIYLSEYESK